MTDDMAAGTPVETVAVLADAQRRSLYGFVRRVRGPVTREEAAAATGMSAKLAAFHLDKLVAAGLLRSRPERPGETRKVGRKPLVYEPTDVDIRVSIPERRPDLIAEILLDAVLAHEAGEDARAAALRMARRRGEDLGVRERERVRPGRLGPERSLTLTEATLERGGFEPRRTNPGELRLLNCPFHRLAQREPRLICGMNHAYVSGFLAGLETTGVDAVLAPRPGECCVELRRAQASPGGEPCRAEAPPGGEPCPGHAPPGGEPAPDARARR